MMTYLNVEMARGMAFTDALDSVFANLGFLKEEGWIDYRGERFEEEETSFRLTLKGWQHVRDLQMQGGHADAGFVAMSFDDDFSDLFNDALCPAIQSAGWRPVRADREHHVERIDDWIMNQISGARFLVVDSTAQNVGAIFEAGFALGLNRPVIWTVEKEDMGKGLHFDIRQFNHLSWHKGHEAELVEPLEARILAAVGRGPHP